MHSGVMSDYAAKGLIEPVEPYLREAGIDPASFTDASRRAVTIGGRIYGLPWDSHGGLFHVNLALLRKAGLMRGDQPILPQSADELLRHARQFKARTGKPYLIQSLVGEPYQTRNSTLLMAQNAVSPTQARRLRTPEARRIVPSSAGSGGETDTLNQDTPPAIATS